MNVPKAPKPKGATTPQEIIEQLGDAKLKLEDYEARLANMVSAPQVEELLKDAFAKQESVVNDLLVKYDQGVRKHIDEQVFKGVKLGISEYDKLAKENFLTKGDAATGEGGATTGGQDFVGFLMKRVEDAFSGNVSLGGGSGTNEWMMDELATFKRVYEQDLRLKFRNFLKSNYGVGAEAGHVELSGTEPGR